MPKPYKAKDASYYYRVVEPEKKWQASKFLGAKGGNDDVPSDVYEISLQGRVFQCNCPASYNGRNGRNTCKHVDWFLRWRKLNVPEGTVTYYNSADDKFYPVLGLSTDDSDLSDLISKPDEPEPEPKEVHPGSAFMQSQTEDNNG